MFIMFDILPVPEPVEGKCLNPINFKNHSNLSNLMNNSHNPVYGIMDL